MKTLILIILSITMVVATKVDSTVKTKVIKEANKKWTYVMRDNAEYFKSILVVKGKLSTRDAKCEIMKHVGGYSWCGGMDSATIKVSMKLFSKKEVYTIIWYTTY